MAQKQAAATENAMWYARPMGKNPNTSVASSHHQKSWWSTANTANASHSVDLFIVPLDGQMWALFFVFRDREQVRLGGDV